jgi:restriction system protein
MATRRAKKSKGHSPSLNQVGIGIAGFGAIALIANNPLAFAVLAMLALSAAAAAWYFIRSRRTAGHARLFASLSESIDLHENALVSYYNQSRSEDLFGNSDERRWQDKVDTFLEKQIVPNITDFTNWRRSKIGQQAAARVYEATALAVAIQRAASPLARVDATNLTPIEYEMHCAELLKASGWVVRTTPKTRDGGADLIAEKHDWRLIIQCKRYSQPVGNKAVQEVHSAKGLYNGNLACVVAPTGFTKQAQREAKSHSIHLLHHSALPAFAEQPSA